MRTIGIPVPAHGACRSFLQDLLYIRPNESSINVHLANFITTLGQTNQELRLCAVKTLTVIKLLTVARQLRICEITVNLNFDYHNKPISPLGLNHQIEPPFLSVAILVLPTERKLCVNFDASVLVGWEACLLGCAQQFQNPPKQSFPKLC